MTQKHDIGWKKRNQPAASSPAKINGTRLATDLVKRGLATSLILERNHKPVEKAQP